MLAWYLVIQLYLAGAPGPQIYVPARSHEHCQRMGERAAVDLETARDVRPVFRLTHRCVQIGSA